MVSNPVVHPDGGGWVDRRSVWLGLGLAALVTSVVMLGTDHGRSWHYFSDAAALLTDGDASGGGLDTYRSHPEFQFGPIVLVLAAGLELLPSAVSVWVAMAGGLLVGVVVLRMIESRSRELVPAAPSLAPAPFAAIAVTLLVVWGRLAAYTTHIDDVLALLAVVWAGRSIDRGRPAWTVVLGLVVAAAAKPWALIFAPLVVLCPGPPWRRVGRVALVGLLSGLWWVPFVVGSPGTVEALRNFAVEVDPNSGLRALGILDTTTPSWLRAAQLILGLAAVLWVVLRTRSWPAAMVAGISARLLIDPATHHYYIAGFVLAGLAWELDRRPGRWPWRTMVVTVVLELAAWNLSLGGFMPAVRFVALCAVIIGAIQLSNAPPTPRSARSSTSRPASQPWHRWRSWPAM